MAADWGVGEVQLLLSSRTMLLSESARKRCAKAVEGEAAGAVERSVESGLAILGGVVGAGYSAGQAGDEIEAGAAGDVADDVVRVGLGDEERLRGRDGEAVGVAEGGGGGAGAVVEALADGGVLGGDRRCRYLADAVVASVGDVEVAADVDGEAGGAGELTPLVMPGQWSGDVCRGLTGDEADVGCSRRCWRGGRPG